MCVPSLRVMVLLLMEVLLWFRRQVPSWDRLRDSPPPRVDGGRERVRVVHNFLDRGHGQYSQSAGTKRKTLPATATRPTDGNGRGAAPHASPSPPPPPQHPTPTP